jgi:hypothetical protein
MRNRWGLKLCESKKALYFFVVHLGVLYLFPPKAHYALVTLLSSHEKYTRFIGLLQEQTIEAGILIYSQAMTPSANKVIASMAQQYSLEAFQEAELLVNITHHIMVPKHEVMKPEEKKALLTR